MSEMLSSNQEETQVNPEIQAKFDRIKNVHAEYLIKAKARIANLVNKMNTDRDNSHTETYARQMADAERTLRYRQSFLEFMRIPESDEDAKNRAEIIHSFPTKVAETVPDNLPLVFHGTDNISVVRKIIKDGGLLTPEQKGESMTSFAVGIDVAAKTNIRVPCEFAEPGLNRFMPYGAIFAFMPKAEEIEQVNQTGNSTEVFGGVDGVSFRDEPARLYGIITTQENITRVQDWCEQYGLPKEKVLTHDGFIETMSQTEQR